jgi:hypothetical protein
MNNNLEPKRSEAPEHSGEEQVNPAVKAWLQNVIVPAMVERYIIENSLGVENIQTSHDHQTSDSERSNT